MHPQPNRQIVRVGASLFAVVLVIAIGIYFRLVPGHFASLGSPWPIRFIAERLLYESIKAQLGKKLDQESPHMNERLKGKQVEREAKSAIRQEGGQFRLAVQRTLDQIRGLNSIAAGKRTYLLEADSYYYYYLTKQLAEGHHPFASLKNGRFLNPLRLAPQGSWDWLSLHPVLGYGWFLVHRTFRPDVELMESLCYAPLILMIPIVITFFWTTRLLGLGIFSFIMGSLSLLLAPVFVQRSAFGWFDTDPYNYLFPLLILASVLACLRKRAQYIRYGMAAGVLSGTYALFWFGWPFVFILTAVTGSAIAVLDGWVYQKDKFQNSIFRFVCVYTASAALTLLILLSPEGCWGMLRQGWNALGEFAVSRFGLWPSAYLTVGEAKSTSPRHLIHLTGNYVTACMSLIGLIWWGIDAWRGKNRDEFYRWLTLALMTPPLVVMALHTERFSVLLVLPISLLVCAGVQKIHNTLANLADILITRQSLR